MQTIFNINHYIKDVAFFISTLLLCYSIIFPHLSVAQETSQESKSDIEQASLVEEKKKLASYSLPQILQLPNSRASAVVSQWTQLISRPGNNQEYFASSPNGKVSFFVRGEENKSDVLLDLNSFSEHEPENLRLNGMALHPSFSIKDERGYRTFYTAHTEKSNPTIETLRIESNKAIRSLAFEAVITEWQLSHDNLTKINLYAKREVVRIPVPNLEESISQISFHPYLNAWDDDFGLLYIALHSAEAFIDIPLYSGAILRINPKRDDLDSYTVPKSNPFLNYSNVHNSLFLFGAQKIQQFIWPNKYNKQLLISHHFKNSQLNHKTVKQLLTLTSGGEDWRDNPSHKTIFEEDHLLQKHSVMTYWGSNSKTLRNKIIILQNNQLYSLQFDTLLPEEEQEYKLEDLQAEWALPSEFFPSKKLLMFKNTDDDLLFLKRDLGAVYQLLQAGSNNAASKDNVFFTTLKKLAWFVLVAIILFVLYQFKQRSKSAKSLVRKQYSRIVFNEELAAISFYKRHNKKSDRKVQLSNIISCDIILGDTLIYTLDTSETTNDFCDEKAQELYDTFKQEATDKMVTGKVRKISVCIHERNKMSAMTCLYLRKGNDRITKKSYFVVVDELINWCWLIAQKKSSIAKSNVPTRDERSSTQSLHQQQEIIKSALEAKKLKDEKHHHKDQANSIQRNITTNKSHVDKSSKLNANLVDIQLVNTLEKLVELKQQGFLDEEEFIQAKAKLLNSLIDS